MGLFWEMLLEILLLRVCQFAQCKIYHNHTMKFCRQLFIIISLPAHFYVRVTTTRAIQYNQNIFLCVKQFFFLAQYNFFCGKLQVHQNLLASQQALLLNKNDSETSSQLPVVEQFNTLTNMHNETLAKIMDRESVVSYLFFCLLPLFHFDYCLV